MKKWILVLLGLGLAAVAAAKPVKVVLKDGTIVNGDMLGQDAGVLTLETKDGKSKDISLRNIKKMFDADGNSIALDSLSSSTSASEPPAAKEDAMPTGDEDTAPAPRRHRKAHAYKSGRSSKAGPIMLWTGTGVAVLGVAVWYYGLSLENDATSSYYPSEYYGYADSEIDGKWYTAAQYEEYYTGVGYAWTGGVVTLVGAAVAITGAIVGSGGHNDEASLLDIQDGKLAWGIPDINYLPGKTTANLLTAEF